MELETNTDSGRKLASIQQILKVEKHPNADSLDLVTVLGWQVIEKLGALKEGDLVVYLEIDSVIPADACFLPEAVKERISKQSDKTSYRVKTVKLRKEISQGLILPFFLFENTPIDITQYREEDDVTGVLGIQKYEPPVFSGEFASQSSGRKFPSDVLDKTDETRVQSSPKLMTRLQGLPFYVTEKCDGTSGTFLVHPDTQEFLVCSRNMIREKPECEEGEEVETCAYWTIAQKYNLENLLQCEENRHLAIQGEICGPNIQKNLLNLKEIDFFVFNIVDTRYRRSLPFQELVNECKRLGLKMVPIEEYGDNFSYTTVGELLKKAEGKYRGSKQQREGLVFRSQYQKISFKVINNLYLLKNDQ